LICSSRWVRLHSCSPAGDSRSLESVICLGHLKFLDPLFEFRTAKRFAEQHVQVDRILEILLCIQMQFVRNLEFERADWE